MRVLFIQNNGIQESIGVANLSGILKANGHETDLLLVSHSADLIGDIRKYNPGLIAFSALTGVHHSIEKLAVRIKRELNVPIIVGGPHPTYSPEMIFGDGIDVICRGEGELAMLELADTMERDGDVTKIRNLHVKTRNGTVYKNDIRPAVPLDELPMPDRELYYKYPFLRDMPMKRFISSMGCPYPCTFCHEPVIRDMYRANKSEYLRRKSVPRAVAEIKYIADRYPLKHVHFSDDLFFIRNSYKWLEEFAELYPKEVGIPWNCNIRYDSVNQHAADLLEKAMCYGAAVGLESGNEEIREIVIKKRSKNEHIIEGARLLREKHIKVLTTNMIGLPGETLDNALETVQLNMELKSDYVRANTFLPGSIGGDAVRAYGLARLRVAPGVAVASVLLDRLLGVLSIVLVGIAGLVIAGTSDLWSDRAVGLSLLVASGVCFVGAAVIFSARAAGVAQTIASRLPYEPLRRIASELTTATRAYANLHGELANVLAGSVAVQVLRVIQAYCLGRALGLDATLAIYFAFIPLILLVMLLPVSINGLGTSQVAFVLFFGRVGVPQAEAFALSVLFVALGVVGNLPGGFLYAFSPQPGQSV